MEKKKILLCDNDENLGMLLREFLESRGYGTIWCPDSTTAYDELKKNHYDLCILDVELPVEDGFSLAQRIKEENHLMPIIFLTAKDSKRDKMRGFRVGADDYITKPFSVDELSLRIEAILRRVKMGITSLANTYKIGKYTLDTRTRNLKIGKRETKLTHKENALLGYLCAYANSVLERDVALAEIWNDANYFAARSMDVYITRLRKLLKDDPSVELMNIHGVGYKLVCPEKKK